MDQELTKELANKLMALPGEARGIVFKTDSNFILKELGKEGLNKLEKELTTLGFPIDYEKIDAMFFYPIGLRIISLLAIKKVFSFDDAKIKQMGIFASKTSFMIKLFINYFLSVEKVFLIEGPKIWNKHYSFGEFHPVKIDEEKKIGIIHIKNAHLHPIFCLYLGSYLCGFFQMLINTQDITFEETKCSFRGDEYHEYTIKWK